MDEEVPADKRKLNKRQSDIQNESVVSLGRRSSRSCESSSSSQKKYKGNLIQMKSVEGIDSDEDIYEYYLIDQGKRIIVRSSIGSRSGSVVSESQIQIEQPIRRRLSSTGKLMSHDCQCDDDNCLMFHCSCYNEPNQMCSVNGCCPNCIQMKVQLMQSCQEKPNLPLENRRIHKNPPSSCLCQKNGSSLVECVCGVIDKQKKSNSSNHEKSRVLKPSNSSKNHKSATVVSCSCKKSHCLKKYCACYALGKKCSSECECDSCQNHPETGDDMDQNMEQDPYQVQGQPKSDEMAQLDIDQFLEQKNYENQMMPLSMQFEHPDLHNAYHL